LRDRPAIPALLLALAIVTAAVSFGSGCSRTQNRGAGAVLPEEYVLRVLTDPVGATVRVDGEVVGATPLGPLVLANEDHTVAIEIGGRVFEETIAPSEARTRAIYLRAEPPPGWPPPEGFALYDVTSRRPGTAVYMKGAYIGEAPLTLHLCLSGYCWLSAQAEGAKPERRLIDGFDQYARYPFSVDLTLPEVEAVAGRVEFPTGVAPPALSWPEPHHGVFRGSSRQVLFGTEGQMAVVSEDGPLDCIFALSVDPGDEAGARPVVAWRTRGIAYEQYAPEMDLVLVGWKQDRLFFLAPETDPADTVTGLLGLGLWEADVVSSSCRRVKWWPHWSMGRKLEKAWLTSDGKAAVVHTRDLDTDTSHLHVIGLATEEERVLTAAVPVYEPGGCTVALRSADGWTVAWSASLFAPRPGQVTVLDLRSGQERAVTKTEEGLLGRFNWSPDGKMLAVGHAGAGEDHWVSHGEDSSALYPASFIVVTPDGRTVGEVRVPGEILDMELVWSADGSRVGVIAVEIIPVSEATPEQSETVATRRVYAGSLGGRLALVADPDENAMELRSFGFFHDGRMVVGLRHSGDGRPLTLVCDPDGETYAEFDGYPLHLYDEHRGSYGVVSLEQGILLGAPGGGVYLLTPDGTMAELLPAPAEVYSYLSRGKVLVLYTWGGLNIILLDRFGN
jgi:hypothetical protein